MQPKDKPHYVISLRWGAKPVYAIYSSRRVAARAAARAAAHGTAALYVLEDCGDHWGLWAGFVAGGELLRGQLEDSTPWLADALDEAGL